MEPTLILLIKICAHSFHKVGVAIRGSLDSCDPMLCLPNLQFYMKEFLLRSLFMQGRAERCTSWGRRIHFTLLMVTNGLPVQSVLQAQTII